MLNSCKSDYSHEHVLRSFTFNPQLPLRLIPPVTSPLPREPSFTLTLQNTPNTPYICTPRGVVGSLRPAGTGELFIGRQGMDECGQFVNDILLGSEDTQASRRHVCISYGRFWQSRREIPREMVAFLMGKQRRLGARSVIQRLPTVLIGEIFAYLYPRKALYLTDCGTLSGTYIRARDFLPIEEGSLMLTSPTSGFEVAPFTWSKVKKFEHERILLQIGTRLSPYSPNCIESTRKGPVLWIMQLEGEPSSAMLVRYIVGLIPVDREVLRVLGKGETAVVEFTAGKWWVKETNREGFGVWLSTSLVKERCEARFKPRWVEITRGCEIRASSTVISLR